MGFKHWVQGLEIIFLFIIAVAVPCFFIAIWGAKMVNDLGNNPSKNSQIQAAMGWKILLVEVVSFVLLTGVFVFLYNIQNE